MLSFHVKFVQTDRRMDRKMDRQTDGQTTIEQYAPDLSIRGHNNIEKSFPPQFPSAALAITDGAFKCTPKGPDWAFQCALCNFPVLKHKKAGWRKHLSLSGMHYIQQVIT